jgi:hypothetical protein
MKLCGSESARKADGVAHYRGPCQGMILPRRKNLLVFCSSPYPQHHTCSVPPVSPSAPVISCVVLRSAYADLSSITHRDQGSYVTQDAGNNVTLAVDTDGTAGGVRSDRVRPLDAGVCGVLTRLWQATPAGSWLIEIYDCSRRAVGHVLRRLGLRSKLVSPQQDIGA